MHEVEDLKLAQKTGFANLGCNEKMSIHQTKQRVKPPVGPCTSTLMEAQESGEMMEHVDEANFTMDGLKPGQPLRIQLASLVSLLSIFNAPQQRRLLRTQGWSQIATHLPGRTDNEIKNFWNSCIKKKLILQQLPSSSTITKGNTNSKTKSTIPSQPSLICNTNSVSAHAQDAFASCHSHGLDQNAEFPVYPDTISNQLISYSQLWMNATSAHNHETFHGNTDFTSPTLLAQSLHSSKAAKPSTCDQLITIPALLERHTESDGMTNENDIMFDYSSFAALSGVNACSSGHSYSNIAAGFANVYPGATSSSDHELLGIRILEDHMNRHNSYQLAHIEGRGERLADHSGCSRISNQEANAKPIPAISGGSGPLEIDDCKGGTRQVTVWAHEDMYSINSTAASDFFNQSHFS